MRITRGASWMKAVVWIINGMTSSKPPLPFFFSVSNGPSALHSAVSDVECWWPCLTLTLFQNWNLRILCFLSHIQGHYNSRYSASWQIIKWFHFFLSWCFFFIWTCSNYKVAGKIAITFWTLFTTIISFQATD